MQLLMILHLFFAVNKKLPPYAAMTTSKAQASSDV